MNFKFRLLLFTFIIGTLSCKKKDDLPPTLILKGDEKVIHILNTVYNDEGATATDETDGNITSRIFIENQIDVDKVGEYTITYHVTDEAGNEAKPITRLVSVYNQANVYGDFYNIKETNSTDMCEYVSMVYADSTHNFGLVIDGFACNSGHEVFVQINDTTVVLPYQILDDSLIGLSVTGSGFINDSVISINYMVTVNDTVELWNAVLKRQTDE